MMTRDARFAKDDVVDGSTVGIGTRFQLCESSLWLDQVRVAMLPEEAYC